MTAPESNRRRRRRGTLRDPAVAWSDHPELVKRYLDCIPDYAQLCAEVAYILQTRLKQLNIEVASITSRAKTLDSFLEKLTRKRYIDPFDEITDFAGVRVVCLYGSDLPKIEELIKEEFEVKERVDKISELGSNQFGYAAVHFIVNLGRKSSGARYDTLRGLACEIQTRTVLQDAWSIIQHHLEYKQESDVPTVLRRKLNGLAAVFEMADDRFEQIRSEREQYVLSVTDSTANAAASSLPEEELNLDSLRAFLELRYPQFPFNAEGAASSLAAIDPHRYRKIGDISAAFERHSDEVDSAIAEDPSFFDFGSDWILDIVMWLEDRDYAENASWARDIPDFFPTTFPTSEA